MGLLEVQVPARASPAGATLVGPCRSAAAGSVCPLAAASGAWLDNGSRMSRETHVRFCESGGVRFPSATHLVAGFQHETDARRFQAAMRARFEEFSLALHAEKTRLIEFGRYAASNRKQRGLGKPESFTFLGFIFICVVTRRGQFQLKRQTRRDRMRIKLKEIKEELRRRMHQPTPEQGGWLRQVVTGFF